MKLNTIKEQDGATRNRKRVGRGIGSGRGKTSGSGHKGQKARSGVSINGFEGGQMPLQMRLPKYGFTSRIGLVTSQVRTSELNKVEGKIISIETLKNSGVITSGIKRVKIMLSGKVEREFMIQGLSVSKGARQEIEKAGGQILEVKTDHSSATAGHDEPDSKD